MVLRWRDTPVGNGPAQDATQLAEAVEVSGKLHWFEGSHDQCNYTQMMTVLAADHGEEKTVLRPAWVSKRRAGRLIGRTKGGMNTTPSATARGAR